MAKTIAFIPARGGSKGIPLKNVRLINGRPLIYWVLDAATDSKRISEVVVSTDCKEVQAIVNKYGKKVKVIMQTASHHTDISVAESAMMEYAQHSDFTNIILIQATSPLITGKHLDEAIWTFYNTKKIESLCSVSRLKKFTWRDHKTGGFIIPLYDPGKRPRRQDWDGVMVENGAFYIISKNKLIASGCRVAGRIGYYELPESHLFEVDDFDDFMIMETLLKHYKGDQCLK